MVSETGAYISIRDLSKKFVGLHGESHVLKGISLEVLPGDLTVFIGPSGCGKSTLLRCLNGLETMDEGSVTINDVTLEPLSHKEFHGRAKKVRSEVGMVFQQFNLFPHLSLLENITKAPVVVKKVPISEATKLAKELLLKVGLASHADHYPHQLSGGQQQRAAIARALALKPKVMLYDEPTSALDPELVDEVLQVMKKLDGEGITQILVTHEMRFARAAADKIVFMEGGKIVEMGDPDYLFTNPQDDRTKRFLRNFI